MKELKIYLSYAGFCFSKANHAVKGDEHKDIKFNALFCLLEHPEHGWILIDTGYSNHFYSASKKYPDKIYSKITKVFVNQDDEVKNQLKKIGVNSSDIKHIIITHFHADHIAGLKDFENATFYCSKKAFYYVKKINNFFAFSKGILKKLLPENFENRLKFIEDISTKNDDTIFGKKYDFFNDNSLIVYELPGHAVGQIGVMVKSVSQKQFFLISDACWSWRTYKQLAMPHPIVRLIFHSWKQFKETVYKIKKFNELNPEIIIMPTHCNETTDKYIINKNTLNEV